MNVNSAVRVMFVTHQLSLSGAPMAMMGAIKALHLVGVEIEVVSLMDGPLSSELDALGVPWSVERNIMGSWQLFFEKVHHFSAVVVNTLVAYPAIFVLRHTKIPTLWWLHETEDFFEMYDGMPDLAPPLASLGANVVVLAVSHRVREVINRRYGLSVGLLPPCVEDCGQRAFYDDRIDRVRFLTLGYFSEVKGQDLLAEAIGILPKETIAKCHFCIYGNELSSESGFKAKVEKLLCALDMVELGHGLSHDDAMELLGRSDFCLIPSREETFSVVAAEAMAKGVPCVITATCGVAGYIEDGVSGIVAKGGDSSSLAAAIESAVRAVRNPQRYSQMVLSARQLYEKNFSPKVFCENIVGCLYTAMRKGGEND